MADFAMKLPTRQSRRRAVAVAAQSLLPRFATLDRWIEISGVGRTSSYQLLAAGKLRAKKRGKSLLIDVLHGLEYLNSLPDADVRLPNSRRPVAPVPATTTP